MAVWPKKRFSILQRDGFTCKYCGWKPPFVQLQVDHVIPKSEWGWDNEENLVSCCSVCNSGKWKSTLWKPDANFWKKTVENYIYKEKMKFYDEWNQNRLGMISEKTKVLISIFYANMYKWDDGDNYQSFLTVCGEWKPEDLEREFLLWWEFCTKVLDEMRDCKSFDLIELISDDSEWSEDQFEKRLNYFLTKWLSEIMEKKYVLRKYTLYPYVLWNEQ